jgi:radical SAM protein (TIGR01212 family)
LPVRRQIEEAIAQLASSRHIGAFIAYFQPGTNTHGDLSRLAAAWWEAAEHPHIVGVAVGTRPDVVPDPVLDVLADLNRRTWVQLELGVQTVHDQSLLWLRRGHTWADSRQAILRARQRRLFVVAHVILGIPGEDLSAVEQTARHLATLKVDAVKIHHLHVLRNTPLAQLWKRGDFQPISREEYVEAVVRFLELLPPECVIERLVGDAPAEYLLAPTWSTEKAAVLREIEAELARRGSYQGARCGADSPDI